MCLVSLQIQPRCDDPFDVTEDNKELISPKRCIGSYHSTSLKELKGTLNQGQTSFATDFLEKENEQHITVLPDEDNLAHAGTDNENEAVNEHEKTIAQSEVIEIGFDTMIAMEQDWSKDMEFYKDFQKMTTIPAATLSIASSFSMMLLVSYFILSTSKISES